jgi:HEPN domain-containing protein
MAEVGSYIYLSRKDAVRAQQMFDLDDYSACGRFCEQSVEKSLKAYMEIHGDISDIRLMSLHKPRRLYERCCELGLPDLGNDVLAVLSMLADYYYDTNYPGDAYFELTELNAREALKVMKLVNDLVDDKLIKRQE